MSRADIIAITKKLGPMTSKQIAMELGLNGGTVRLSIRRARKYGTKYLRIADWRGRIALYGPGPEPDAEGGSVTDQILAYLELGHRGTARSIANALGVDYPTVDETIRRIRKVDDRDRRSARRMHVVAWERKVGISGREAAIWAFGNGKDVPRPDFSDSGRVHSARRNEKHRVLRAMNGAARRPKCNTGGAASLFAGLGATA